MTSERRAKAEDRLRLHSRWPSKFLSTRRDIIVYLPPGYHESGRRYPVLYMQDGQNLFDPATAFGGQDWAADIAADNMADRGEIEPPIIVGIYNTGVRRMSEYTPTRDARRRKGGKAARYAEMLAREIKPFIDHEYRTLKPAAKTVVGGSSLGGLASLICVLEYPAVFGGGAILSPSVWWDNRSILKSVHAYRKKQRSKIWLDTGTCEGDTPEHCVQDARVLKQALEGKGWKEGETLAYHEFEGADHSERAWAARFGAVLAWFFAKQS